MRIAFMGAGGVGGYFGAKLALAGADVAFVARGAHLAALRAQGLTVESGLGAIHLPAVTVTDDPASLAPVDLVVVGVKLWDTEAAAQAIRPLVDGGAAVISFQNSVHKDAMLRGVVGEAALIGGVGYIAASILRPGVIRHVGTMQRLVFGEFGGMPSARTAMLLDACLKAGITAEVSPDIARAIWEKFVFLVGLSGATSTMRSTVGPIRAHPRGRALLLDLLRETVAVGRAHGIDLPADFADNRLAFCDGLPAAMTSSMHHDLDRGNRLELPWLAGGVVELGAQVGVATPANRFVADVLSIHQDGRKDA